MPDGFIVGRFQPIHNGHLYMIKTALDVIGDGNLYIFVGSAQESRTPKNPFNFIERA